MYRGSSLHRCCDRSRRRCAQSLRIVVTKSAQQDLGTNAAQLLQKLTTSNLMQSLSICEGWVWKPIKYVTWPTAVNTCSTLYNNNSTGEFIFFECDVGLNAVIVWNDTKISTSCKWFVSGFNRSQLITSGTRGQIGAAVRCAVSDLLPWLND